MRREKNYIVEPVNKSSFLSCEKDAETIVKKLFVEDPYISKELKRLLLINTKDCLDDRTNQVYKDKINKQFVFLQHGVIMNDVHNFLNREHIIADLFILVKLDNSSYINNGHYIHTSYYYSNIRIKCMY